MSIKSFLYRKQKLLLILLFTFSYFLLLSPTAINSIKSYSNSILSDYLPFTTQQQQQSQTEPIILDMSPKASVDREIASNHVVVFSKSYCPYCKKAKATLAGLGESVKVFELDQMEEGADWQAYLGDKTGQRTVPSIFIDGEFIGGSSDLEAKKNSGELAKLLKGSK